MATIQPNSEYIWRAHPAHARPVAAMAAGLIILAVAAAVWVSFGVAWGLASAMVLVLALHRFFFPSRFSIDQEGIVAHYLLRHQRLR